MSEQKRILLVEDEEFLREIYTDLLKGAGYEVDVASDGDQALTHMKKGGYDLVLLDVMLPEKDGRTVLFELQSNPPSHPNRQIAYMTNLSHDGILAEGKDLGVKNVIIKSDLTPDEFLQKVKKMLD